MKKTNIAPLPVITLGHPTLRKIAREVKDPTAPEIQTFVAQLLASMRSFGGVGIAAPQVNRRERIMIIASAPGPFYPRAPKIKPVVLINPVLLKHSSKREKGWEGCGSFMGVRAKVSRFFWVDVTYTDMKGKQITRRLEGFLARIFQHELDHLNGIMFIDHVSMKDLVASEWLSSTVKKGKS